MKTSREQSTAANPSAVDQQASSAPGQITADQIAITAYLKAQARGFEPGHELEDWFAAEAEYQQ